MQLKWIYDLLSQWFTNFAAQMKPSLLKPHTLKPLMMLAENTLNLCVIQIAWKCYGSFYCETLYFVIFYRNLCGFVIIYPYRRSSPARKVFGRVWKSLKK